MQFWLRPWLGKSLYHPLYRIGFGVLFGFSLAWFSPSLSFLLAAQNPPSQSIQKATIVEILDGSDVYIEDKKARVNDSGVLGQHIRTGESRIQLRFNTGAIGRLSPQSNITLEPTCVRVQQGKLLVDGVVQGCTPSMIARVQGTTYVLEVTESSEESVTVLDGEVTANRGNHNAANPPKPAATPQPHPTPAPKKNTKPRGTDKTSVVLKAGEQVNYDKVLGQLGLIRKLSQQEFTALLKGNLFKGFRQELPGLKRIQAAFQALFPNANFPIPIPSLPIQLPRFPF
jgi:hypothetical protein